MDDAVAKHIDAGCPKPAQCVTFACCCPGCRAEELVPCICNLCGKNTCFKHRFPADHYCKRTYATTTAPSASTTSTANSKSVEKKPEKTQPQSAQPASRSQLFTEMQQKSKKKTSGLMYKLQLSKAKAGAQGNQSIPPENREYLEVVFPLTARSTTYKTPLFMFFSTKWSIGKSLQHHWLFSLTVDSLLFHSFVLFFLCYH